MLGHNRPPVSPALFENFERGEDCPEVLNEFKSLLIVAYERAIEDGISSGAALTAMLDLVAAELKRFIRLDG